MNEQPTNPVPKVSGLAILLAGLAFFAMDIGAFAIFRAQGTLALHPLFLAITLIPPVVAIALGIVLMRHDRK